MSTGYMSEKELHDAVNEAMGGYFTRGWLREAIRRGDVRPVAKIGNRQLYDDSTIEHVLRLLKVTA